jgi:hypothetical protein
VVLYYQQTRMQKKLDTTKKAEELKRARETLGLDRDDDDDDGEG